jgi:hypothetical protein
MSDFPRSLGYAYTLPRLIGWLKPGPLLEVARAYVAGGLDGTAFTAAVKALQGAIGLEADGVLGPKSWGRVTAALRAVAGVGSADPVEAVKGRAAIPAGVNACAAFVRVGGCPVPIPEAVRVRVGHAKVQLTKHRGCEARNVVLIHWGGFDLSSCYNVLSGRGLGTHLICAHEVQSDGVLQVEQVCDLLDTTWHAGEVNRYAIGVDIARSPLVKYAARYPDAVVKRNSSGRGEPSYVALPEGYGKAFRPLIAFLAALFGLPYTYQGHGVLDFQPDDGTVNNPENLRGVLGHHNVDNQKWDVAPWADECWPPAGEVYAFGGAPAPAAPAAPAPAAAKPAAPAAEAKAPKRLKPVQAGDPAPAAKAKGKGKA